MGRDRQEGPRAHRVAKRVGEERSPKLPPTVHESGNQFLRDKRLGRVERTIREKATEESGRTTNRLAGRVGTRDAAGRIRSSQTKRNQTGTRDPATSIRTRDEADLEERRSDAALGLRPERRRSMED